LPPNAEASAAGGAPPQTFDWAAEL